MWVLVLLCCVLTQGYQDTALLHYVDLTYNRTDCSRLSLAQFKHGGFQRFLDRFGPHTLAAVKTANILSHLYLQAPADSRLLHNDAFYYALAKISVESDDLIFSSSIAFQRGVLRASLFQPTAYRQGNGLVATVDKATNQSYDDPSWIGNSWFTQQASKNASAILAGRWGGGLLVGPENGVWAAPYYDCGGSNTWVVTYSLPFYGPEHRGSAQIVFRGVATVSFDLKNVDIDQCSTDDEMLFANTHKCDPESTECIPIVGKGFRSGGYKCQCKSGFYVQGTEPMYVASQDTFMCHPCQYGCDECNDDTPCFVRYDMAIRSLGLGLQSFCSTVITILGLVVFLIRKSKVITSSMWIMLEMVIVGGFLLHQTVLIRYFEPNVLTCLLEPWIRELGFYLLYGAIILKIYRILAEFQTRKALRVCVRERDLVKYMIAMTVIVTGYMSAWTAVFVDNLESGQSMLEIGRTSTGLRYKMCRALWWDYVTETGELLFLTLGLYLSYCIRNASIEYYKDKLVLCLSLYIESIVSIIVMTIRHVMWLRWDPDYIFLLYVVRVHLTATVILIITFVPKVWYYYRPLESGGDPTSDYHSDRRPETLKLHEAIMSSGDLSEINLVDMDPEDIRSELRRIYTQLQVLRNKTMRKDNPHISKRRGGRKGTHRRFSLQAFHKNRGEVSRTPEESTISMEGSTVMADSPQV